MDHPTFRSLRTTTTATSRRRAQSGVTIVESLIVMTVAAVTLGAVAPSFEQARQLRHLEGTAAELETDIQHARSNAVAVDRSMRLTVHGLAANNSGAAVCYVVHTGAADACRCEGDGAAVCVAGEHAVRTVHFAADGPLQLRSNVKSIVFDSAKGTSTPTGTLKVVAQDGRAIHLVVNVMGRVRSCSPGAAVAGHKAC